MKEAAASTRAVELKASCLSSKWGFRDGDVLDGILIDANLYGTRMPEQSHLSFAHEVLARCVERYLLPRVPRVVTYRIGTSHNPIRTDQALTDHEAAVTVKLTRDQVIEVAQSVVAEIRNRPRGARP